MKTHHVVKAGAIYFALVFASAFVLRTIRVLWLVPTVGTRAAELLEMPLMLAVVIVAARWARVSCAAGWPIRCSECATRGAVDDGIDDRPFIGL